jgi:hypothetical protein
MATPFWGLASPISVFIERVYKSPGKSLLLKFPRCPTIVKEVLSMKELRNPLTLAVYGLDEETGLVRVTDQGKVGLYTAKGEWHSGEFLDVCPHMCSWIGGPNPVRAYGTSFRQM